MARSVWAIVAVVVGLLPTCSFGADSTLGLLEDKVCGAEEGCGASFLQHGAGKKVEREHATFSQMLQAAELPDGVTKDLFHSFKICTACKQFQRFGETWDGGYLMCMDDLAGGQTKAAYSMGVGEHDKWSVDINSLLGVPVHQFDCTIDSVPQTCSDCHFYPVCIAAPDGQGGIENKTSWTMDRVLAESGQGNATDRSLVMKMDIDQAEWYILAANGTQSWLKKFGQIIFEFHNFYKEENHPIYLSAMQHLLAQGFSVAHAHGNNLPRGMYRAGSLSIPNTLEVTMVASGEQLPECLDSEVLPLDQDNIPFLPSLPASHLP